MPTLDVVLRTFAEKVDRLEQSSLRKVMATPGWKVSWNFETHQPGDEALIPDLEYLESYVLNMHFFIQDNEPTLLRNMASLYESECNDPSRVAEFNAIRDMINNALDESIRFKLNNQTITHRDIFAGMIYSRLVHSKEENYPLFKQMSNHPFLEILAMVCFLTCVVIVD